MNVATATAIGFIIIFTLLAKLNVRSFYRIMAAMLVICLLSLVLSYGVMWSANPVDFCESTERFRWNTQSVPNGHSQCQQTGVGFKLDMGCDTWTNTSLLMANAGRMAVPCIYRWRSEAPTGESVRPLVIVLSLLINGILYAAFFELTYHAFGYPFMNAIGFSNVILSVTPLNVPYFLSLLLRGQSDSAFSDRPWILIRVDLG